jgi:hypothetical protein
MMKGVKCSQEKRASYTVGAIWVFPPLKAQKMEFVDPAVGHSATPVNGTWLLHLQEHLYMLSWGMVVI